jgi:hypothetical protein
MPRTSPLPAARKPRLNAPQASPANTSRARNLTCGLLPR